MSYYPPPDLLFALADDVFSVFDAAPEFLVDLLTEAEAQQREVAEFNFNTTDLTVDLVGRSAVISDVLNASTATAELSIEALLAPFELARMLPPRCTTYLGRLDWRDLLMNGGLGPEDWPHVLDKLLGQDNKRRRR